MSLETECIIWCRHCEQEQYRVYRKELSEGVYEHIREPEPDKEFMYKCPVCKNILERM